MGSFAHIAILATDVARLISYYTKVFKMRILWYDDSKAYLTTGNCDIFGILPRSHSAPIQEPFDLETLDLSKMVTPNFFHFGYVTTDQSEYEQIRALAVQYSEKVYGDRLSRDGTRSCYFYDPENNILQLVLASDKAILN